jgi:hypothetical protein
MNYSTGEPVRVGDTVRIEDGRTTGTISDIVETKDDMKNWHVDEPGVMVRSAPFGLVFWPLNHSDPAVFVARAT